MKLTITPKASQWFEDEMGLSKGDSVKIFGKYGGKTNVHVGLSTGIEITTPMNPLECKEINGIRYFTETQDDWFFGDYHLVIDIDEKVNEPIYCYE